MKKVVSVDIGSTYTKGAVFSLKNSAIELIDYKSTSTTVDNLSKGFNVILDSLGVSTADHEIFFSSSAKGGLAVAAIGLVPDLTLNAARLTALSAGAKITDVYAYKLSIKDIQRLEKDLPDIILFSGGTDGGAENYNLHNAELLSNLKTNPAIIYAGNKFLQPEIENILEGKQLYFADNILPELGKPFPEPARERIREIFLDKIVSGKGLDKISETTTSIPNPTPFSMFEFINTINKFSPDFGSFCVVDMGGATTDFYSSDTGSNIPPDVILKGVREPKIKRTVEGDLGMRVSAKSAYDSMKGFICDELIINEIDKVDFEQYIDMVDNHHAYLPEDHQYEYFDQLLAAACCMGAAERHCGYREEVYTSGGKVWIQKGKDLTGVKKIIGSGGFISRVKSFELSKYIGNRKFDDSGRYLLLPEKVDFFIDKKYLFPLLANIAFKYPKEAVCLALDSICKN
jgi:uncharacterized protein (TIGR01319 family)